MLGGIIAVCITVWSMTCIIAGLVYGVAKLKPKQVADMDKILEQLEKINVKISKNSFKSLL